MREGIVLCVEEDDAAFRLLKAAFEETEPETKLFRVHDGEQAIAFLRKDGSFAGVPRPDLILLSVNPPSRPGLEVLAEIAASDSLRSIPVVVLTASPRNAEREEYLALGAQDLLNKPAKFDELVMAVSSAYSKASSGS